MSTITDILATDSPSSSIGTINANFDNLNADKIEATQAVALTNKTIDGDLNTLQDIPYSAIKSTSRTGLDVKLVTGTAGTNGNLVKWDANGDAIDTGVAVTDLATTAEMETAIAAALETKEMFVPVIAGNTVASSYDTIIGNTMATNTPNSAEKVYFLFKVPANFTSLSSAVIAMIPDTTETVQWDLLSEYAAQGEAYNLHTESLDNQTQAVTPNQMTEIPASGVLVGVQAGDWVGLRLNSDTTALQILGLNIKYT